MLIAITSLALLGPLGIPGAQPTGPQSTDLPQREKTADASDVEILRRLLVEAIEKKRSASSVGRTAFSVPLKATNASDLQLGFTFDGTRTVSGILSPSDSVTHSRGFHMPGAGAIFTLDMTVPPTLTAVSKAPEEADADQDDDWERVRREVETGASGGGAVDRTRWLYQSRIAGLQQARSQAWELDPHAIDEVVDAVIETVARHGQRVRVLDRDEHITVALYLTPSEKLRTWSAPQLDDDEEPNTLTTWSGVFGASLARPQRVVIRIPVGDIEPGANGDGARRLRQRTLVHRY